MNHGWTGIIQLELTYKPTKELHLYFNNTHDLELKLINRHEINEEWQSIIKEDEQFAFEPVLRNYE